MLVVRFVVEATVTAPNATSAFASAADCSCLEPDINFPQDAQCVEKSSNKNEPLYLYTK